MVVICHLPRLYLSPLSTTPQSGRNPRLIYKFLWSKLNKQEKSEVYKYSMRFGRALHLLLNCILAADLQLYPPYLFKVNLVDAYVHI